jgi:hypothetical protein
MARGRLKLQKNASTTQNLVSDRGLSLPQVNFADSFILSEIGNEDVFEFDYDKEEWFLDIAKILPEASRFEIIEPKPGDTIVYDNETGKFINDPSFVNNYTKIVADIESIRIDLSRMNDKSDEAVKERVIEIREVFNNLITERVEYFKETITRIDRDVEILKNKESTDYTQQINYLTTQILNLTQIINSQQQIMSNIPTSGMPSIKYQMIDKEIPYGQINGQNKSFHLNKNPLVGSESVHLNGVLQDPVRDYTLSGNIITFIEAPLDDTVIRCNYRVTDDPTISNRTPIFYNVEYGENSSYFYAIIEKEIPIGLVNGINDRFELANNPINGTVSVYLNGVLQEEGGPYANYHLNGKVINFVETPLEDMVIRCTYKIY